MFWFYPYSLISVLLDSQTDSQAATTEEEEHSEDSLGPCLHLKILYLGATICRRTAAISAGLEICSCQRTHEKKHWKQQLAALAAKRD